MATARPTPSGDGQEQRIQGATQPYSYISSTARKHNRPIILATTLHHPVDQFTKDSTSSNTRHLSKHTTHKKHVNKQYTRQQHKQGSHTDTTVNIPITWTQTPDMYDANTNLGGPIHRTIQRQENVQYTRARPTR